MTSNIAYTISIMLALTHTTLACFFQFQDNMCVKYFSVFWDVLHIDHLTSF